MWLSRDKAEWQRAAAMMFVAARIAGNDEVELSDFTPYATTETHTTGKDVQGYFARCRAIAAKRRAS